MDSIRPELEAIRELIRTVQLADAEKRCQALISALPVEGIREWEVELRDTINRFLPKRRKALVAFLDAALAGRTNSAVGKSKALILSDADLGTLEAQLRTDLADLSRYHIFQWSSFYRDVLVPHFRTLVEAGDIPTNLTALVKIVHREFASHAHDIFSKGYQYLRNQNMPDDAAVLKSVSGLQRFLEIPIEFYSTSVTATTRGVRAISLRRLTSATLSGILEGYGAVRFGDRTGWQLLPRFPKAWAHYLPFLDSSSAVPVANALEPGQFQEGLAASFLPLLTALDDLVAERSTTFSGLPVLGQYVWQDQRLDVSLQPPFDASPPKLIELQCFFTASAMTVPSLDQAARRGVALALGPMRPDVAEWTGSHDILRSIAVNVAAGHEGDPTLPSRIKELLRYAITQQVAREGEYLPLTYNFARDFPLHNPLLARYFHVYRRSVRDLLRVFEGRNGVRLWCSVRRSGKTTACFDLSTSTGHATVVTQTCDSTDQRFEANVFYDRVVAALDAGLTIPKDFFRQCVHGVSVDGKVDDRRFVFVLDEYETLFERLRLAVRRDRELRYSVVQPLLNQLVAFSRDHLLVLIGQRPDAHFILMDQNQLSAYVQQDAFPLFGHGQSGSADQSELEELVRKVLTERVAFHRSFVDAVHAEAGGHPFLTVKLLVALCDWLVDTRRSARALCLTSDDFAAFASTGLTARAIGTNREYAFFHEAISEALSDEGVQDTPWLHAVYWCLRRLAQDSPGSLRCSRGDFAQIVEEHRIPERLGFTAEYLLATAAQANFLAFGEDFVTARIPLLARLASQARRRMAT